MEHGGKRKGAGRRQGSVSTKTKIIAEQARDAGITPIEVITNVMRHFWNLAQNERDLSRKNEHMILAANAAKDAAPYCHPRLSSVDVGNKDSEAFTIVINKT